MTSLLRGLTTLVSRRPGAVVVLVLLTSLALGSFIPQLELTNSSAAFSPETPEVLAQEELRERFSDAATAPVQVVVRGEDVVSADGVATVTGIAEVAASSFGDALAARGGQPAVVSWLQPAFGAAAFTGEDVSALDDAGVDRLQRLALSGPPPGAAPPGTAAPSGDTAPGADPGAFAGALLAGDDPVDAPAGIVIVQLDRGAFATEEALIEAELAFVDELAAADLPLDALPFSFEMVREPDEEFQREIGRLFQLAALIIVAVLAVVLRARRGPVLGRAGALRRSVADMAIAMVTVLLAVVWTQGLLVVLGPGYAGLLNSPTPPTQIVPVLLLALGVDYAIHTQTRYREELAAGRTPTAVVSGLGGTLGVALFLSMLTTSFGFLTNRFSPIPAIQDLGALAAIGIVAVFVLSNTLLPAVRLLLDRRAERRGRLAVEEVAPSEDNLLARVALVGLRPAVRAPVAVLTVAVLLAGGGAYGLTQMDTEFSIAAFLPEDSDFATAFTVLDEEFGGGLAEVTEVLVTGDDVLTVEHHAAIVRVGTGLAGRPGVVELGGGPDLTTPVSTLRAAQAAATTDAETTAVAEAVAAGLRPDGTVAAGGDVAQVYRTMAAAFPAVAGTVSPDGATPAVRLAVRTQSEVVGVEALTTTVEQSLLPLVAAGSEQVVVSEAIVTDDIVTSLADSQVRGLLMTVIAVMLLLGLVYWLRSRQPGLGVLVMLPVGVVVLWTFGAMWLAGIPFDPVTAVISSLVVGVGVDFCIHLGERYVEELDTFDGDVPGALRSALQHTGAALAGSAATTTFGFSILTLSSITPFQRLGVVTIYAMIGSLLATMFVLPPLLVLYGRRQGRLQGPGAQPRVEVPA